VASVWTRATYFTCSRGLNDSVSHAVRRIATLWLLCGPGQLGSLGQAVGIILSEQMEVGSVDHSVGIIPTLGQTRVSAA
jgi:hypothetical protein